MKYYLTILLFTCTGLFAFAQNGKDRLILQQLNKLDKALISKDTVTLNRMLADDVMYCHSTGFVQSKRSIIDDLYNGVITYTEFKPSAAKVKFVGEDVAYIRFYETAAGLLNGNPVSFDLNVFMLWKQKGNDWVLVERMAITNTAQQKK